MNEKIKFKRLMFLLMLTAMMIIGFSVNPITTLADPGDGDDPDDPGIPGADDEDESGEENEEGNSWTTGITLDWGTNFDIYAWWNQDISRNYNWNPVVTPVCDVTAVRVKVLAWDVDNPGPADPEIDKVYLTGQYLGDLTGASGVWSWTTFWLTPAQIDNIFGSPPCGNDPYALNVFIDVDSTHSSAVWAVTVDKVRIKIWWEDDVLSPSVSNDIPPSPAANDCVKGDFTIQATITDPYCSCGICSAKVHFWDSGTWNWVYAQNLVQMSALTWAATIPYANLGDGCYKYRITAKDCAGHSANGGTVDPIILDTVKPAVTLVKPSNGDCICCCMPFYVEATVTDPGCAGIDWVKAIIKDSGGATVLTKLLTNTGGNTWADSIDCSGLNSCSHTLQIRSKDNCGNVGKSGKITIGILGCGPTTVFVDANGPYGDSNGVVYFFGTATIPGCCGAPVSYDWDFGDGTTHGNTIDTVHRYDNNGDYTATLSVIVHAYNGDCIWADQAAVKISGAGDEPVVKLLAPEGGSEIGGTVNIEWLAWIPSYPNPADFTVNLYYSNDNQNSMRLIASGLHNNDPNDLSRGSYPWDTTRLADGEYFLLVEAINLAGDRIGHDMDPPAVMIDNGAVGTKVSDVYIFDTTINSDKVVKDGHNVEVSAGITGGIDISSSDIVADLSGLGGGSNVPADEFDGLTAIWSIENVECTPSNGEITVTVSADGDSNSDTINAENKKSSPFVSFLEILLQSYPNAFLILQLLLKLTGL